jgi:hypothetical protein
MRLYSGYKAFAKRFIALENNYIAIVTRLYNDCIEDYKVIVK